MNSHCNVLYLQRVNNTFYLKKYRATNPSNKCLSSLPVGSFIALTQTTPPNAHTRGGSDKGDLSDKIRALCNALRLFLCLQKTYLHLLSLQWLFPGNVRGRAGKLMNRKLQVMRRTKRTESAAVNRT